MAVPHVSPSFITSLPALGLSFLRLNTSKTSLSLHLSDIGKADYPCLLTNWNIYQIVCKNCSLTSSDVDVFLAYLDALFMC